MHNLLWGSLVIIAALGVGAGILWWGISFDATEDEEPPIDVLHGEVMDPAETQVIRVEPLLIDTRAVEVPHIVMDELGEWKPWEHTLAEPQLLGHVLLSRRWGTLTPAQIGMHL